MSKAVKKFSALFIKALTDKEGGKEKSAKQKETDYYNLNFFINGLKKKDDFQACLDEYLKIYKNYLPADRRSKFVFAQLLKKRIEETKPEDKYLDSLSDIINDTQKPFTNPIKLRYEDCEDREKKEIKGALDYKLQLKKQQTSVLDLLKNQFYKEQKRMPDEQELLKYNPVLDSKYLEKFEALRKECQVPWSNKDPQEIEPALKKYISFLSKENDPMKLFQVLKWMRDIVTDQPYQVGTNQYGETETYKYTHDVLDCELYFQAVFWLLIWARRKVYYRNRWDFTKEEKGFFINPLSKEYYFSNFYNRFEAARKDDVDIIRASVLFLRLLIFAKITISTLANDKEVTMVRSIIEDKSLKTVLKQKVFYLNAGPDLFKGNVRIGSNMGKCNVIYFSEYKNDREEFIFIEFVDVKNVLLKVSAVRLAKINEDSFYTLVWEQTRHLLVMIPAFWRLIGYLVTFLTGGAYALVKDVLIDVVIDKAVEHIKPSSDASAAMNLGFALFRKGKFSAGNLEKAVQKGFKNLGKEETKAARALLKMTDEELKAARLAGKLTEEEIKAIRSAAKYIDDEAKAMKAVDDLVIEQVKVANSKSNAVVSTAKTNKATANPKLSTVDDAVKNNGTGKVTGGGDGGGAITPTYIPDLKKGGVIDWRDAMKISDDLGEKSVWVKRIDTISNIADPAAKRRAIEQFGNSFTPVRNVEIEVILTKNAERRGLSDNFLCRYDPDTKKIFLHENAVKNPGVEGMKQFREAVKTVEIENGLTNLALPKNFKTAVSGVPQHLKGQVKTLQDAVNMQVKPVAITFENAMDIARDLHTKSEWLRELAKLSNIKDMNTRIEGLRKFITDYSGSTYKIKILGKEEAIARGLGGSNIGTFVQGERTIYLNESVFRLRDAVNQVGHEVGAAELYRVLGINKEAIPTVLKAPAGVIAGDSLTHTLDILIRKPQNL